MDNSSFLLFEDARGIYIPQNFAEEVDHSLFTGYSQEDIDVLLEGPEHEHYWETWDYILNNAECNFLGRKWRIEQDMDVWLVEVD